MERGNGNICVTLPDDLMWQPIGDSKDVSDEAFLEAQQSFDPHESFPLGVGQGRLFEQRRDSLVLLLTFAGTENKNNKILYIKMIAFF